MDERSQLSTSFYWTLQVREWEDISYAEDLEGNWWASISRVYLASNRRLNQNQTFRVGQTITFVGPDKTIDRIITKVSNAIDKDFFNLTGVVSDQDILEETKLDLTIDFRSGERL